MAEIIKCPNCSRQLQVPEGFLGQPVQCPDCNHTFTAMATAVTSEPPSRAPASKRDTADDELPRSRRRRYDDEDDGDGDIDFDVRRRRRISGEVPNYMVQSVLVTLFCCMPLGIAAIISASKVNDLLTRGDYDGAVQASENAKKMCWLSFVLGLIGSALWCGAQILTEGRHFP